MTARTIGVVTVSRSDYGIYLPVLRGIQAEPALRLSLIVGGMHLSPAFGLTVKQIEADGFSVSERVEMLLTSDTPEAIATFMGVGTIGFARAYSRLRPDLLLMLGDRFEMHAAAVAALPFAIPIAHIHGGESTEGLIDEALRHSMTKMSHLHFTSTEFYRQRILQMGEEPWRVTRSGAPSLDHLRGVDLLSPAELKSLHGVEVSEPFLLVTYHPVTLQYEHTERQMAELLSALEAVDLPVIFTYPNADTHSQRVIEMIRAYVRRWPCAQVTVSLGTQAYFSLMRLAAAMVGNSSSGVIEAASFRLPVVNVGDRQRGRYHDENVLDVPCERADIAAGIRRAVSPSFRTGLSGLVNAYGDGHAAERIVSVLRDIPLDAALLMKRFCDQPVIVP